MTELYLIRHGKTYGNTLGRYIGVTDEDLCPEGRAALAGTAKALEERGLPADLTIYASPLKRCVQTAKILFPGAPVILEPELRECDFGEFENKNYQELSGNPSYQAWVDSGGTLPFPGGESREDFAARCVRGFSRVLGELRTQGRRSAALVVHGGTIMSILAAYAEQKEDFYHWQVKNGEGFHCLWDEEEKGGIRLYEISHLGPAAGLPA